MRIISNRRKNTAAEGITTDGVAAVHGLGFGGRIRITRRKRLTTCAQMLCWRWTVRPVMTEVLSGDYYQPLSTSSPHQIWSAAMVISPMLRGMFGLQFDAAAHTLTFAPHVPADWKECAIQHVAAGDDAVNLKFARTADSITVIAGRDGSGELKLNFLPAVSLRAEVVGVTLNGKSIPFLTEAHSTDQHVIVNAPLGAGANTVKIRLRDDFAVTYSAHCLAGERQRRVAHSRRNLSPAKDQLDLKLSGMPGHKYQLHVSIPTRSLARLPESHSP